MFSAKKSLVFKDGENNFATFECSKMSNGSALLTEISKKAFELLRISSHFCLYVNSNRAAKTEEVCINYLRSKLLDFSLNY